MGGTALAGFGVTGTAAAGFAATGDGPAPGLDGIAGAGEGFAAAGAGFLTTGAGAGTKLALAAGVLTEDAPLPVLTLRVVATIGLAGGILSFPGLAGAGVGFAGSGAVLATGAGGRGFALFNGAAGVGLEIFLADFLREGILAIPAAT